MSQTRVEPSHHFFTGVDQHLQRGVRYAAKIGDAAFAQQHDQVHCRQAQHNKRCLQQGCMFIDRRTGRQMRRLAEHTQKFRLVDQLIEQCLHALLSVSARFCAERREIFIVVQRKANRLGNATPFAQFTASSQ